MSSLSPKKEHNKGSGRSKNEEYKIKHGKKKRTKQWKYIEHVQPQSSKKYHRIPTFHQGTIIRVGRTHRKDSQCNGRLKSKPRDTKAKTSDSDDDRQLGKAAHQQQIAQNIQGVEKNVEEMMKTIQRQPSEMGMNPMKEGPLQNKKRTRKRTTQSR